tara:strand:+ start:548 stop:1021 length:474 start_codon:yes stop_codon:yes gene_type:complete
MYKKFNITKDRLKFILECSKKIDFIIPSPIKIRCIGWNQEVSKKIAAYIIGHQKIGTYSLPWLHQEYPWSKSNIGDYILHVDFNGEPFAIVQILKLELLSFKDVNQNHTNLDGPPVRDFKVWKKLHTEYWSKELKVFDRIVTPDMPVVVEKFKCIFS